VEGIATIGEFSWVKTWFCFVEMPEKVDGIATQEIATLLFPCGHLHSG